MYACTDGWYVRMCAREYARVYACKHACRYVQESLESPHTFPYSNGTLPTSSSTSTRNVLLLLRPRSSTAVPVAAALPLVGSPGPGLWTGFKVYLLVLGRK